MGGAHVGFADFQISLAAAAATASTSRHATRRGGATFLCVAHREGDRQAKFGLVWVAFGAVAPSGSSAHMFEVQTPADEDATRRDATRRGWRFGCGHGMSCSGTVPKRSRQGRIGAVCYVRLGPGPGPDNAADARFAVPVLVRNVSVCMWAVTTWKPGWAERRAVKRRGHSAAAVGRRSRPGIEWVVESRWKAVCARLTRAAAEGRRAWDHDAWRRV
jgi:hypothetical protein